MNRFPRIAIIGAGVSGLRCASLLLRSGCNVTLFEARNRIGGRVHQVLNGGHLIDTGSNWIHGTEGNPIMTLAEETGTIVMDPPEGSSRVVDRGGNVRTKEESGWLAGEFWDMIMGAFKYADEKGGETGVDVSLAEYIEKEWKAKFNGEEEKVRDLIDESKLWGQFVGSPIERQSLRFFWLEEGLEGGNVFVASTYQKILGEIAKPVLEASKEVVKLNTEVEHIQYRGDGDAADTPVKVMTTSGEFYEFDEVVVTCPLGWLKKNQETVFTPALPPRLVSAIDSIGYGALEKLYISFPSAFWLGEDNNHNHNHSLDNWSCFTNFHSPTYHPVPSSRSSPSWNQSVISMAHMPSPAAHPTLLFYMMGDAGAYTTSQTKNLEPHSDKYNRILEKFAKPFYSRLPNFSDTNSACTPTSFYLTNWQHDPHAGYGSYSTFRTGLAEGDKDIEVMRDAGGLSDGGKGLWMAGEHTAPFVALGTTTGAWWSGEGVAKRIVEKYGLRLVEDRFLMEQEEHGEKTRMNGDGDGKAMKQPD